MVFCEPPLTKEHPSSTAAVAYSVDGDTSLSLDSIADRSCGMTTRNETMGKGQGKFERRDCLENNLYGTSAYQSLHIKQLGCVYCGCPIACLWGKFSIWFRFFAVTVDSGGKCAGN